MEDRKTFVGAERGSVMITSRRGSVNRRGSCAAGLVEPLVSRLPHVSLHLRRQLDVVINIVMGRAWHIFFIHTYTQLKPDNAPMTCGESGIYVLEVMLLGAVILALTAYHGGGPYAKHLAPLCGMLSGWSLKHLVDVCQVDGQGADNTDIYFELGVACLFSMLAIFLIWAVHVINVYARKHSEDLAIFTGRVKTLFTNASGLGTAAAWYAVARSIIKMRDYEAFVNSGDADAAGRDAALFVGDLPAPSVLRLLFSISATTICSVLDEYITEVRHEDAVEMEEIASVRIQARLRGKRARRAVERFVRARRTPRTSQGEPSTPFSPRSPRTSQADPSSSPPKSVLLGWFGGSAEPEEPKTPRSPKGGHEGAGFAVPSRRRSALDKIGLSLARMPLKAPKSKSVTLSKVAENDREDGPQSPASDDQSPDKHEAPKEVDDGRLVLLQLRLIGIALMQRTLGFVVGFCWYDFLHILFFVSSSSGILPRLRFAVTMTVLCTLSTMFFLAGHHHGHVRTTERELLAAALGLAQGWAWSEFVDALLNALLSFFKDDLAHVLMGLAASTALTACLLGVRVCLARVRTAVVMRRWQDASVRARAFEFASKAPLTPAPKRAASPVWGGRESMV